MTRHSRRAEYGHTCRQSPRRTIRVVTYIEGGWVDGVPGQSRGTGPAVNYVPSSSHDRPASHHYQPSHRAESRPQELVFEDYKGREIRFEDGLLKILDDFHRRQDPALSVLGFLAMLDTGKGRSRGAPAHLLKPFHDPVLDLVRSSNEDFDDTVARLHKSHMVDTSRADAPDATSVAFSRAMGAKKAHGIIVEWLFENGLGPTFFDKIVQRLCGSRPREIEHIYRVEDVYRTEVRQRKPFPGGSDLMFAGLLVKAARDAIVDRGVLSTAKHCLKQAEVVVNDAEQNSSAVHNDSILALRDELRTLRDMLDHGDVDHGDDVKSLGYELHANPDSDDSCNASDWSVSSGGEFSF